MIQVNLAFSPPPELLGSSKRDPERWTRATHPEAQPSSMNLPGVHAKATNEPTNQQTMFSANEEPFSGTSRRFRPIGLMLVMGSRSQPLPEGEN